MSVSTTVDEPLSSMKLSPLPRLRTGERVSREEFERRYETMTDVKAELLDGVVYVMSSPVSVEHGSPHGDLMGWIVYYKAFTPGLDSGDNTTTRLSKTSEPQPDVYLRILESHGGSSRVDEDDYVSGGPELLGEVAKSSTNYDLTVKMPNYCRAGVREFILWRVEDQAIDWFILRDGNYEPLAADNSGIIRSETFPGLWLDVEAMIRGDVGTVFRVLQQGIASAEHAAFVERLRLAAV